MKILVTKYINITIAEQCFKIFERQSRGFSGVEVLCEYIRTRTANVDDGVIHFIFPIIKEMEAFYGLNDEESVDLILKFFKNRLWIHIIPYVKLKEEYNKLKKI